MAKKPRRRHRQYFLVWHLSILWLVSDGGLDWRGGGLDATKEICTYSASFVMKYAQLAGK
jgi:hypothetical protein